MHPTRYAEPHAKPDEPSAGAAAPPLPAGLYLVGTPIGNLGDLTFRALEILRRANAILAEDTRVTARLLARYEIRAPLISCHKFNEAARTEEALDRLRRGQRLALVTDSGMPGVSDPGARLAAAARAAGLPVTAIPGPSAVTMALALSGFGGGAFRFAGFLPHKSGARRRELERLLRSGEPVVLFESPFRFLKFLDELKDLAPDRPVFVGRELTKLHEETRVGTAAELQAAFANRTPRGEFTLVLAPAPGGACESADEADDPGEGEEAR